jgi:hypothetical protein
MAGKAVVAVGGEGITSAQVVELFETGDIYAATFALQAADPDEVRNRIRDRELGASSPEELFGGGEVTSGKNYINKPFSLQSVEWQPSDIAGEGLPLYAVLHVVTPEGEAKVLTCGAEGVVRKAAIAAARGWLPLWLKITEGKTTEAGYKPLDLVSAPESERPF